MKYIIIPARLASKRLPNKLLLKKNCKPIIQHTWENVIEQTKEYNIDNVYIATPDDELVERCEDFGAKVIKTGKASCGTERMYLASLEIGDKKGIYINRQCDLPIADMTPLLIRPLVELDEQLCDIICLHYKLKNTNKTNYDITKVVFGYDNETLEYNKALYYSRYNIPYKTNMLNINVGIYTMKYDTLAQIYNNKFKFQNTTEKLEQLYWLELGYKIISFTTKSCISINTQQDYLTFIQS